MRLLILDQFDVTRELDSKMSLLDLTKSMVHSSKYLNHSDLVIYISFNKNNARNFFHNIVLNKYHSYYAVDQLSLKLLDIFERYAYLYDLSLSTNTNCVTFDFKLYVIQELNKISNFEDIEGYRDTFYIITDWRYQVRLFCEKNFHSFINYKFYFTIMEAWDKFWMVVLGAAIGCTLYIFVSLSISEKRTIRYELGSNNKIEKIVDNASDESVMDITNMRPEQIIKILDSLNASLRKYPDSHK